MLASCGGGGSSEPAAPPNQPPTVSMVAPANNFKANATSTVLLTANAADADGSVTKVEFFRVDPAAPVYDISTLVGQATAVGTPPAYQLQTAPLAAGVYNFAARGTDNQGATTASGAVRVTINALPTVSITAPAANENIIPGTTTTLRASARDADGSVTKIEFFVNNGSGPTLIGEGVRGTSGGTPSDEYTLTWSTALQGSYSITARATDNDGGQQTTPSVAVNVPANLLPTVALDNPVAGTNAPTTLSLSASASDSDGSITSVQFFNGAALLGNGTFDAASSKWRLQVSIGAAQSGTYTITASATDSLGDHSTTASKSVTIAPNVPPVVNMTSSASVILPTSVTSTTLTLTASASDSDGIAKVEFFNGATKLGESASAPYQVVWSGLAAGTYSITARATDTVGSASTSPVQSLAVVANQLPMVTLDNPVAGTNAPTTLSLSASASDSDGSITSVQFFNGAALLGNGTFDAASSKWRLQVSIGAAQSGTYTITASATDSLGDHSTTASKSVTIAPNVPPVVNMTSSASVILPTSVTSTTLTLTASASDSDGIAKVEFFNGATKLGESASAPYQVVWSGLAAGTYSITARATDTVGSASTSPVQSLAVVANQLPMVTLDNPVAGTNAPTTLSLSASTSDSDGSITSVQFFNGAALLGNGTFDAASSKWRLQVSIGAAQSGTYTITASATDNLGGQRTTPSKSVTIAPNVPPVVNVTSSAAVNLPAGNAPAVVTLIASASDGDGIAKVEFFNGAAKIGDGTLSAGSYQVTWTNVTAGSYTITAKAIDTVGSATTSAAQTLVVSPNLEGPWATLSAAQKAGLPLTPNRALGDPGVDAGAVMTAIGVNTVAPKYVAAMAQALRKLADLPLAVTGTAIGDAVNCPEGGKIAVFSLPGSDRAIDLIDCKIGGFNFYGGGDYPINQPYTTTAPDNQCTANGNLPPTVPPDPPRVCTWPSEVKYTQLTASSFRIVVKTLQVSGNGAPEALGAPFPHNVYGYGYVECTVNSGGKTCLTSHENSFLWGNNLAWTNWFDNGTTAINTPLNTYATDDRYTLNGSLRPCAADPQPENLTPGFCQGLDPTTPAPAAFHIRFDGMTVDGGTLPASASGRAIVYGSNGWSVVTRLPREAPGIERVTVQQFAPGTTAPVLIGSGNYRCPVDSNGFFQCALVP